MRERAVVLRGDGEDKRLIGLYDLKDKFFLVFSATFTKGEKLLVRNVLKCKDDQS